MIFLIAIAHADAVNAVCVCVGGWGEFVGGDECDDNAGGVC